MSFVRLFIAQARDAETHYLLERDLCEAKDYLLAESGYVSSEVWSEDNGLAAALLTTWSSREAALGFHQSSVNNLLTAVTKRHSAGSPVVKVFRVIC